MWGRAYRRDGVESDGLEADEVVARRNRRGDRGRPGRVISDHLACGPASAVDGSGKETSFVDLEPLQGVGVDSRAGGSGALREVSQLHTKW